MTTTSPVSGSTANWTLEPPVSTPILRMIALAASRSPWYCGVGQRLRRRHGDAVAGVHAHGVDVLDGADDDDVVGGVAHDLELELVPADDRLLEQDLRDRAEPEAVLGDLAEALSLVGDAAAGAAERERRPDDERQPDLGARLLGLAHRVGEAAARHAQADLVHGRAELEPVLGAPDRRGVGADHLDLPEVEHAGVLEVHGEVERRLPAERRQQRVGAFDLDDPRERRDVERLDVGPVAVSGSVMIVAGLELTSTTS